MKKQLKNILKTKRKYDAFISRLKPGAFSLVCRKVTNPEYYLQFIFPEEKRNEEFYFFDVHSADSYLEYEFSECGLDSKYGIMGAKYLGNTNWNTVFDNLDYQTFSRYRSFHLANETRLVFEVNYYTAYDYYSGATEEDVEIDFIGWLNNDLQLIIYNK